MKYKNDILLSPSCESLHFHERDKTYCTHFECHSVRLCIWWGLSYFVLQELQPSDDSLPDRIAETLHNLSHSYHALSDLTFNFRSQEPRYVRVLPPLSPHNPPVPLGGLFPPRRATAATQVSLVKTTVPTMSQNSSWIITILLVRGFSRRF